MKPGGIQALIGDDLRDHAGVRYTELGARALLNRCNTSRMPDCWTINPYRGCSFGCVYCYARYTHEFLGIEDPGEFERRIFIKRNAAEVLAAEASPRRLRARPIAIGTATDPYQPAEARYGLTRGVLEVLARYRGLEISVTTKSALIVRDLELLRRLAERSQLTVNISLISLDRELTRSLDTRAPTPERRLRTLQTLRESGTVETPRPMGSLQSIPGLSYAQTCVLLAISSCTSAQLKEPIVNPASRMTVGEGSSRISSSTSMKCAFRWTP